MDDECMDMSGSLNKNTISMKLGPIAFYSINEAGIDTLSQVGGWKHGCMGAQMNTKLGDACLDP